MEQDEGAILVADNDIRESVAVEIAGHDLRADAGVGVDEVGDGRQWGRIYIVDYFPWDGGGTAGFAQ